ncbi:hypothetical protein SUDANB95_01970 [Actinosynnema sp. ALI-1.44]
MAPPGAAARRYVPVGERPPAAHDVDWRDAPTPFKRYSGVRTVPPGGLGPLLRDTYGVTRQRWTAPDAFTRALGLGHTVLGRSFTRSVLRPVPSGGALYPTELYVVGEWDGLPAGVYHYDPAHHVLEVLSPGAAGAVVRHALGGAPPVAAYLVVTTFFWKNAFKYGEFGYRLGCLDAGVVVAQAVAAAGARGVAARVRYRFVDAEVEALLGLDPGQEAVCAVLCLGPDVPVPLPAPRASEPSRDPGRRSPEVPRAWSIAALGPAAELHAASRVTDHRALPAGEVPVPRPPDPARSLRLDDVEIDLATGIARRRSALGHFRGAALTRVQLAGIVRAALRGYGHDLSENTAAVRHTVLYCVVSNVEGVGRGVYRVDPVRAELVEVRTGDVRADLQRTLAVELVSLLGCGVCFVPTGDYAAGIDAHGDRWYRVQNLEAGLVAQRIHLAAAALGLACRVNCGYHTDRLDRLLRLTGTGLTSLAQVAVGAQEQPGHHYDAALPTEPFAEHR